MSEKEKMLRGELYSPDNDKVLFEERTFRLNDEFKTPLGVLYVGSNRKKTNEVKSLTFDLNAIPDCAVWRLVQSGDKFTKFGGGTKTIKDYLTSKKIGSEKRKKMVVLASNEEVLIIPGVEISNTIKTTEKTKNEGKVFLI